jgi:predicted O-linked N-acetylglucosamine transferase (SPINDLY family)
LTLIDLINAGQALADQGQLGAACALYQDWLANSPEDPLRHVAWFNLGSFLGNAKLHDRAAQAYAQALALSPRFTQARMNLGHELKAANLPQAALIHWQQALQELDASPNPKPEEQLHTLVNLAVVTMELGLLDQTLHYLERGLALNPCQRTLLLHYLSVRQKTCQWPLLRPFGDVSMHQQLLAAGSLAALATHDDPAWQLLAAQTYVRDHSFRAADPRPPRKAKSPAKRRRIGYLSGDFNTHPVGALTVELFELHDRARFEVFGFCWTPEDGSPERLRLRQAFDRHVPIGHLDDAAAARLIRSLEIDFLVDLQGLTGAARPDILSYQPAAVQLAYLGFPGTCALPAVDYVIADSYVLPQALEPYMTEQALRLPHCFQPSDRQRQAAAAPSRADCGLPEHGFVYCSFNQNFKFTEEVFDCWLRVLGQVPGSVLWLLASNPYAQANMQARARQNGVAAERLVFATRTSAASYLARLQLADLFLDSFPYNAGTTANDALWMACPVLTCSGRSFVSRMAGSLLTAVGLPELITDNLADYERLAVRIGQNPQMAVIYRRYLQEHAAASDLFDMPRFTRDLEAALLTIP